MRYRVIDTFTGPFAIVQDADGGLTTTWLDLGNDDTLPGNAVHDDCIRPELAARLQKYFSGEAVAALTSEFHKLLLAGAAGGTAMFVAQLFARRLPKGSSRASE